MAAWPPNGRRKVTVEWNDGGMEWPHVHDCRLPRCAHVQQTDNRLFSPAPKGRGWRRLYGRVGETERWSSRMHSRTVVPRLCSSFHVSQSEGYSPMVLCVFVLAMHYGSSNLEPCIRIDDIQNLVPVYYNVCIIVILHWWPEEGGGHRMATQGMLTCYRSVGTNWKSFINNILQL